MFGRAYMEHIENDLEVASIFARWQVGLPTNSDDFIAIRNYHLAHVRENHAAEALVCDMLASRLEALKTACQQYYQKPQSKVDEAFFEGVFVALTSLDEKSIKEQEKHGGHWTGAFVDATLFAMRGLLGEKYLDLDAQNDLDFRRTFEREWKDLQRYLGNQYNFLVVPRLSYKHMTRYQMLSRGDATIRRTISTYLIHQCFFYPHFGEGWFPHLRTGVLWPLIRCIYKPLIEATIEKAITNLELAPEQKSMKKNIRETVENLFDEYVSQFDFFLNAPENFNGKGVLGLNENKEAQAEIDEILKLFGFSERADDINTTPFAHYIKQKFDYWIEDKFPRQQNFYTENTNVVTGVDDQSYLTIQGASKKFGVSVTQLRYLDRIGAFKSIRARDVSPTDPKLAPNIRLYPDTYQARQDIDVAAAGCVCPMASPRFCTAAAR